MEQTNDCFVVSFDRKEKMTFLDFKSKNQIFKKISHFTVNQKENAHWDNLKQRTTHCEMPSPMYAIDNEWTLFEDSNNCQWNLGNLSYEDSFIQPVRILLNLIKELICQIYLFFTGLLLFDITLQRNKRAKFVKGITTPFAYVGGPLTSFAFHVEDGDLGSINKLQEGEPKVWYIVPGSEGQKLERFIADQISYKCKLFIRHKQVMVPPSILQSNGIKFARVSISMYFNLVLVPDFCKFQWIFIIFLCIF